LDWGALGIYESLIVYLFTRSSTGTRLPYIGNHGHINVNGPVN
jgi:hypothetical protein